jgi:hypothetical protein
VPTTPYLGIQELTPNQSGKETTVNTAILALEAATNATLVVAMASGDVTLSASQFTSAFIFSTTGLTAARVLSIPTLINAVNVERVFCVQNPSTYPVSVKVNGSSGSTVTIPAGENRLVSADGAGNIGVVGMPGSTMALVIDATTNHNVGVVDANALVEMTNAAANTVTVQPDSTTNLAVGSRVYLLQYGAGATSVVAGLGVTIHTSATLDLRAQYSIALLTKTAANTWTLSGDLYGMGASSLDALSDVDTSTTPPVTGDLLKYVSTEWVPGRASLDELSDVDTTTTPPAAKNVLEYDGALWVPVNLGLIRPIPFFFTNAPNASELLAIYACADVFTIPGSLAGTQAKKQASGANPLADFVLDVRKNNVSIGTITIHSDGSVTLAGAGTTTAIGDVISVHAPSSISAAILNWGFNIVGVI